jgi:Tfp pilus assembly protein PilO
LVFDISRISNTIGLGSFSIMATSHVTGVPEDEDTVIDEKHVHVGFTGGFNQFAAFLNALERRRPAILVDTFRITRSSRENSGHTVNMRLVILVKSGTAVSATAGMVPAADFSEQVSQLR